MYLKQILLMLIWVNLPAAQAAKVVGLIPEVECSQILIGVEKLRAYGSLTVDQLNTSDLPNVDRLVALKKTGLVVVTEADQIDLVRAINMHIEAHAWLEAMVRYANRILKSGVRRRARFIEQTAKIRLELIDLVRSTGRNLDVDSDVSRLIKFYTALLSDPTLSVNPELFSALDQFPKYRGFAWVGLSPRCMMKRDYFNGLLRDAESTQHLKIKASDREKLLRLL